MKTLNYIKYMALCLLIGASATGCKEDELGDAPRLFRPIVSLDNKTNNIVATWDNIKGATTYELELFKVIGEDEAKNPILESYTQASTPSSPYTFTDLTWDEKYVVKIRAIGAGIESQVYETDAISVIYPTKIIGVRTIDVAALITWKTDGTPITYIKIVPDNGGTTVETDISDADFNSGQITIYGLQPETAYKAYAYSGEKQTLDTYEGRIAVKTAAGEDFDAIYGAGKYLDLRAYEYPDTLKSAEIKAVMDATEGLAIILKGGFSYKVNNTIKLNKSVTFVTGLSLAGNAIFVQSGGLQSNTGAVIENITFKKIDFISDIALTTPISATTDAGFGGRQVYNVNGTTSVVNNMLFENCSIQGYRAIVRMQAANEGVRNLTFEGCTLNGIGNQGAVTTTNLAAYLEKVTFSNSTITNTVMLFDARVTNSGSLNIDIKDCTFCYAPMEATGNGTPLFRLGATSTTLTVTNTVFGPSMKTLSSAGGTYQPGPTGAITLVGTATTLGVTNSYKTNFDWTTVGTATYPLDGLESLSVDETGLFTAPAEDNYTIKYNFSGAKTAGAKKWRMQ
jgi:hypothetical protein